jgi:hypothetical protein
MCGCLVGGHHVRRGDKDTLSVSPITPPAKIATYPYRSHGIADAECAVACMAARINQTRPCRVLQTVLRMFSRSSSQRSRTSALCHQTAACLMFRVPPLQHGTRLPGSHLAPSPTPNIAAAPHLGLRTAWVVKGRNHGLCEQVFREDAQAVIANLHYPSKSQASLLGVSRQRCWGWGRWPTVAWR